LGPSVIVGGVQQFTATGFYNDNSTKDITTSVIWDSASPAVASISNQAGSQGLATGLSPGFSSISAKDPSTNIFSGSVFLRVIQNNQSPIARLSANPSSGIAPLTVHFDGSASSDPDGSIVSYSWSFGDGANGTGGITDHAYTTAGTYTVILTVADNQGATGSAQTAITVSTQSSNILFSDEFNRTTGLGSNWQVYF